MIHKRRGLLKNAPLLPGPVGGEMTPQGFAIPSCMGWHFGIPVKSSMSGIHLLPSLSDVASAMRFCVGYAAANISPFKLTILDP